MADYPWIKSYPPPARWDIPIETGPVPVLLDEAAVKFGDRPAVEFMGKKATYKELLALANRAAKGFQALGVGPGVHVGLFLPNVPHYLVAFFGVLKAGGTVVNYSPLDAEKTLEHKVHDSHTRMIVTLDLPQLLPQMEHLLATTELQKLIIGGIPDVPTFPLWPRNENAKRDETHIPFTDLVDNDGNYEPHDIGDPAQAIAVLQYTGGTTGLPKGAMLTHANLTAASNQYRETTHVDPPVLLDGEERTLIVLPLFHIYSLSAVMLLSVRLGSEMILHARFEPEAVVKDIAAKKITAFFGVPTMYTALLAQPSIGDVNLTSVKYCASGGAPLPLEVQNAFEAVTGCKINEGWGMTETSPAGTFMPMYGLRKKGSCGIPVPQVVLKFASVQDPTQYVPLGERGEICIKGPNVMKGYWHNEGATDAIMTADGFMRTGDVAIMDEDGYVFIVDRIKDMLLCGGYNVYPRNIEEAIYQHTSVAEVCVIGVPDAYRGESPKAFITLKPGHPEFTLEELKAFLKDKLGKHEMVGILEFRSELPKTPVGKIQKAVLVEEEAKKRAAASQEPAGVSGE
jgi:long-chain acyl-CoA synthetase